MMTHGEDVALLEEDDVDEEAEGHHGDDEDGDAPADDVGPVGVHVAARLQWLPADPAQYQDYLRNAGQPIQYKSIYAYTHIYLYMADNDRAGRHRTLCLATSGPAATGGMLFVTLLMSLNTMS